MKYFIRLIKAPKLLYLLVMHSYYRKNWGVLLNESINGKFTYINGKCVRTIYFNKLEYYSNKIDTMMKENEDIKCK